MLFNDIGKYLEASFEFLIAFGSIIGLLGFIIGLNGVVILK